MLSEALMLKPPCFFVSPCAFCLRCSYPDVHSCTGQPETQSDATTCATIRPAPVFMRRTRKGTAVKMAPTVPLLMALTICDVPSTILGAKELSDLIDRLCFQPLGMVLMEMFVLQGGPGSGGSDWIQFDGEWSRGWTVRISGQRRSYREDTVRGAAMAG